MSATKHYPFFNREAVTDEPLRVYRTHVGIVVTAGDRVLFTMRGRTAYELAKDIVSKVEKSND